MLHVEVTKALVEDSSVLRHLLELYMYDFSEFAGWDVNDHGLFGYKYLDHYWTEPDRIPFLIRVGGKLAGFVLVRIHERDDGGSEASIAEFFVMRKYRRRGIGRTVAWRVFDMFPGRWEVSQLKENASGRAFWRDVIAGYTGGSFTETTSEDSRRTIQRFGAPGRAPSPSLPVESP